MNLILTVKQKKRAVKPVFFWIIRFAHPSWPTHRIKGARKDQGVSQLKDKGRSR
jgi:hypothetical protein